MQPRRYQEPELKRSGRWWYLLFWQDVFVNGASTRKRKRHKLAPATIPEREAKKMAEKLLRSMNQGLAPIGSATREGRGDSNDILRAPIGQGGMAMLARTKRKARRRHRAEGRLKGGKGGSVSGG
jgi:hypothetical protein